MNEVSLICESKITITLERALTFIDISGALVGAFISVSTYVVLAISYKDPTQETKVAFIWPK